MKDRVAIVTGGASLIGMAIDGAFVDAGASGVLGDTNASFITGADLAVDGGCAAIGPEARGQPFVTVPPLTPAGEAA
ncbi:MAG: hypothetical protein ACE5GC_04550 [Acidimicrobiia bacterium]